MLKCDNCKINIEGEESRCPLCGGLVQGKPDGKNAFPSIPTIYEEFNIMIRIIMFVSIVIAVLSIALNLIIDIERKWYLLVIAGILCLWLSFIFIIKKKDNIPKTIVWQVVIITITAVLWDYSMGWRGWSISYVLPSVCAAAIILMVLAVKILKIYVGDYIVYLLIDALFGLIPIVFLLIGGLDVTFPSIICVAASVISISALILFKGQDIKEELNKRMHV
ncbi:MAG TPA: hypothetical protein GXZ90_00775 [Clostridiales bacterium]|nr:hypothetical protein [Clostridiales bacterium]